MKRFEHKFNEFTWIDLLEPKKEDLKNLSSEFKLVDRIILNSMDPEHLPKYEPLESGLVLFLRVIDPNKKYKIYNIQELTTKITVIIKDNVVITMHRLDQEFMIEMREKALKQEISRNNFLKQLTDHALKSFDEPVTILEHKLEALEEKIFHGSHGKRLIQDGFNLKRKAAAFKKVLKFYSETFNYLSNHKEYLWTDFQAQKEYADRLSFYIDDAAENISSLLNLHLSLEANKTNEASYKTNEIMRVLTVFSIFFLPLNFLVGVYGMNFKNMPELEHPYGYFIALSFMGLISLFIYIWVFRKGWLKDPKN